MQAVMTPDVAKAFAKEVPHITASQDHTHLRGSLKILGVDAEPEEIGNPDETLAELGLEGWEMVTCIHTDTQVDKDNSMCSNTYLFKRKITEE
jgi:hypothetical protein